MEPAGAGGFLSGLPPLQIAPQSGASQVINANWSPGNWDPFGNGGLNAAGPAGVPIWVWLAGGAAILFFLRR